MDNNQAIDQIKKIRENLVRSTPNNPDIGKFKTDSIEAIDIILKELETCSSEESQK